MFHSAVPIWFGRQFCKFGAAGRVAAWLVMAVGSWTGAAGAQPLARPTADSGGLLPDDLSAYDVTFYDLALTVDPRRETIRGACTIHLTARVPLTRIALDLVGGLTVTSAFLPARTGFVSLEPDDPAIQPGELRLDPVVVEADPSSLPVERSGGRLWVTLPDTVGPGDPVVLTIRYGGRPPISPGEAGHPLRTPSADDGGFVWTRASGRKPWVSVLSHQQGGDLWFPCKDSPADRADSVRLALTVPAGLVAVAPGTLRRTTTEPDGRRTFVYVATTPMTTNAVTFAVGPFETRTVADSTELRLTLYTPAEHRRDYDRRLPELLDGLRFFESRFGPYPYRREGGATLVEVPGQGLPHGSLTTLGPTYVELTKRFERFPPVEFERTALHQLAHSWFEGEVAADDWRDDWLHEGFAEYAVALWIEQTDGRPAFRRHMDRQRIRFGNRHPMAPRAPTSRKAMERTVGADAWYKGAWTLHSLRWLLGDSLFFDAIGRYTAPGFRSVTTDSLAAAVRSVRGQPADWFFEVYARQAALPQLTVERWDDPAGDILRLRWSRPRGLAFPMPVPLRIDGQDVRVEMPDGRAERPLRAGARVEIDPDHRLLMDRPLQADDPLNPY